MPPTLAIIGTLLFFLGVAGMFFVKRRRFHRRNQAGIELFKSYSHLVAAKAFEGTVTGAAWIACGGGLFLVVQGVLAS